MTAISPSRIRHVIGVANKPGQASRAEAEADEPHRAGGDGADAEQPAAVAVLVGQRAEQHDGVEIDMRVEERQCRGSQQDLGQSGRCGLRGSQGRRPPGAPRGQQSVAEQEQRAAELGDVRPRQGAR